MNSLQKLSQILSNMGGRYFFYRAGFEFRKRSGLLKKHFPINPTTFSPISLQQWQNNKQPFFFENRNDILPSETDKELIHKQALSILNGNILFFSTDNLFLGRNYDWVTNPDSGYQYDVSKHWTEIADFTKEGGDIKYVWEKSRFSFLYTLFRDELYNQSNHSEFIFNEIENWIDHNPINCGPNYRCSQEISLRVLNWIYALYYYADNHSLTEARWNKIMNAIYWQMKHVYANIDFSRIAVRNNHAITETLGLYIVGTLFPWMDSDGKWKKDGKKWFEEEVAYQVYADGTFLQFSMNYNRVLIQLLTWACLIADLNKDRFKEVVYERSYRSLNFLYQCQEPSNGYLPNYGANDGALFFPLNTCDYRDYRPQLNALHVVLCGKPLYSEEDVFHEDLTWFGLKKVVKGVTAYSALKKEMGFVKFETSGYYLIREEDALTFIRCGNHKDRPSHADNLHIDIWVEGKNVFADSGSYKYNTDEKTVRYFMGTESHNTVMLGDHDQMLKGSRFIWFYWSGSKSVNLTQNEHEFVFEGVISGFRFLNKRILHKRKVTKPKSSFSWQIEDQIIDKPANTSMRQLWHLHPDLNWQSIQIAAKNKKGEELTHEKKSGWFSERYGKKVAADYLQIESPENEIATHITIKK